METLDYTKQANDFLQKTGVKLIIRFKEYGAMPWDKNGEERNIFTCILNRDNSEYAFDFGNSFMSSHNYKSVPITESDIEAIDVFAGLSAGSGTKNEITASINFVLRKAEDFSLSDERFQELEEELRKKYFLEYDEKRKEHKRLDNFGNINKGAFKEVIENAIKRELSKTVEVPILGKAAK